MKRFFADLADFAFTPQKQGEIVHARALLFRRVLAPALRKLGFHCSENACAISGLIVKMQAVVFEIPRILSVDRGESCRKALDRIAIIMEVIPIPADQTLAVGFFGPGAIEVFANFEDSQGQPIAPKPPGKKPTRESGTLERPAPRCATPPKTIALHQRDA